MKAYPINKAVNLQFQQKITYDAKIWLLLFPFLVLLHRKMTSFIIARSTQIPRKPKKTRTKAYFVLLIDSLVFFDLPQYGSEFDSWFESLAGCFNPFPNFIAKFETLAYQCGKTEEQKVEALKKKNLPGTGRKASYPWQSPTTNDYRSWIRKCRVFHDNIRVYEHNQLGKTGPNQPYACDPPDLPLKFSQQVTLWWRRYRCRYVLSRYVVFESRG